MGRRQMVGKGSAGVAALLCVALGCGRSEQATFPGQAALPHDGPMGVPPDIDRTSPLPDPLPEVAAVVNGHPIPTAFVGAAAEKRLQALGGAEDRPVAYRTTMHQYITRQLLYQEAERRGLLPDEAAVEQMLAEQRAQHPGEGAFEAWLEGEGVTLEGLRDELRVRLAVVALSRELSEATQVGDAEARAHHAQFPNEFPGRFEDVAEHVKQHLLSQKQLAVADELIAKLKSEAVIETFLSAAVEPADAP